jgi:hypothetical protein
LRRQQFWSPERFPSRVPFPIEAALLAGSLQLFSLVTHSNSLDRRCVPLPKLRFAHAQPVMRQLFASFCRTAVKTEPCWLTRFPFYLKEKWAGAIVLLLYHFGASVSIQEYWRQITHIETSVLCWSDAAIEQDAWHRRI